MIICDTHCDTLYNLQVHPGQPLDVTMERLKAGGVSVQTMAMYVGPGRKGCDVEALMEGMLHQLDLLKAAGWKQIDDPNEAVDGEDRGRHVVDGIGREHSSWDLVGLEKWTAVTLTVSVEENNEIAFVMYPNPAKDLVTIESAKDAVVKIYSVNGQMLSQQNISEGISTIDLSNLNAGMYFISVNETMVKVVKQ